MDINLSITSFYFLCFYGILLLLYYVLPKRIQWAVLLGGGLLFYLLSGQGFLILYPLAVGCICYGAGRIIENAKDEDDKRKRTGLCLALAGALGLLAVLKYADFFLSMISGAAAAFGGEGISALNLLVPLGISYYTFTMLSYVIDIYYGTGKSAEHFGRFLLFGTWFPALISGPIMSYQSMEEQFKTPHKFQYDQVVFGMQRMLWGFFKKLVISERLALVVNTVFEGYASYEGFYIFVGAVFFVLQLYTDFSGCMDIVLGLSETFGLILPENFKTPFFSRSIAEFWRRWHITLGEWMRSYVFYPLLRSRIFTSLGKSLRKKLGKKAGKQATTFLAMFLLWFAVGIWHGPDWKYVLGSGLIHWCYIVVGEIGEPLFDRTKQLLHIGKDSKLFHIFQSLRTFLLVAFAFLFFRAPSVSAAFVMIRNLFSKWNPGVIFGETLFTLGLDWVEMTIVIVSLLILLAVSLLQERGVNLRQRISRMKLPVRWAIWYALLFYTILLGQYGPDFSAAEFIYQGF